MEEVEKSNKYYSDDPVFMAESKEDLQPIVYKFERA